MTIHRLPDLTQNVEAATRRNQFGESALPFAPEVDLGNGLSAVPQQYLQVRRSLESVEQILNQLAFSDSYPLFAGQTGNSVFIQVGLIGHENYTVGHQSAEKVKIVYGRRWMLEPNTPTSEVVQTAFLAIKKAREHELREKLTLRTKLGDRRTTPFNSHQDLPLMSACSAHFSATDVSAGDDSNVDLIDGQSNALAALLQRINFSQLHFQVHAVTALSGQHSVIELDVLSGDMPEQVFPELAGERLAIVCDHLDGNAFLHGLIEALIQRSDRHVEEHFSFQGFYRFSRSLAVERIAEFSYSTRNIESKDDRFEDYFSEMSYQIDSSKAPPYAQGQLGDQQRFALHKAGVEAGYVPLEPSSLVTDLAEPVLRTVKT